MADLFKKNDFVKDYYTSKFSEQGDLSVLSKYKKIIVNEFFPEHGFGDVRLSVAKKAITEFKKINSDKALLAELMLLYVDVGVEYTDCYGDIDEQFYSSIGGMYERALKLIRKNDMLPLFKEQCLQIMNDVPDMGWGFPDQMSDAYETYVGEWVPSQDVAQ